MSEPVDQTRNPLLRALRQLSMGRDLSAILTDEDREWLDADLG